MAFSVLVVRCEVLSMYQLFAVGERERGCGRL